MSSQLALFTIASIALIITPGQDMVLVMTRSISFGTKAGIVTAAGVSVGLIGHSVLAALGLGALLQASEILFTAMKIAGAIYLVYLGVKAFRAPPIQFEQQTTGDRSLRALFIQGAVSNLSNPKIAIFYFAFLPQFVSADAANAGRQLLALGLLFAFLTFLIKCPIGYAAGSLSGWLRSRIRVQTWINRVSGMVLIALGIRLALENNGS